VNALSKFLTTTYASAVADTVANLTLKVRAQALDMGWPKEVSNKLVIEYAKESVLGLEYGNQKTPPLPAMRTFIRSIKDTGMQEEVEKHLKRTRLV
jgi:hypothetical protein